MNFLSTLPLDRLFNQSPEQLTELSRLGLGRPRASRRIPYHAPSAASSPGPSRPASRGPEAWIRLEQVRSEYSCTPIPATCETVVDFIASSRPSPVYTTPGTTISTTGGWIASDDNSIMLQIKSISELLTKNVHKVLYPHMFLMSRNGTLVAYSTPVDINEVKEVAAMVTLAWNDFDNKDPTSFPASLAGYPPAPAAGRGPRKLHALTVQCPDRGFSALAREVQDNLLLVLIGSAPTGSMSEVKTNPEWLGSPRFPPDQPSGVVARPDGASRPPVGPGGSRSSSSHSVPSLNKPGPPAPPPTSGAGGTTWDDVSVYERDVRLGSLHVQRKKLDAVAEHLRGEFARKGFRMPMDGAVP